MSCPFKSTSKLNFTLKVVSLLLLLALAMPSNRKSITKFMSSFFQESEKTNALLHASDTNNLYQGGF
jgi:hypothetical protein